MILGFSGCSVTANKKSSNTKENSTPVTGAVYQLKSVENGYFLRGINSVSKKSENDSYPTFYKSRPTWSTQKWRITNSSSNPNKYEIKNQYSGGVLRSSDTDSSSLQTSVAKVIIGDATAGSDMNWEFISVEGEKDSYYIKNSYSGLYLCAASSIDGYATQTSDRQNKGIRWSLVPSLSASRGDFLLDTDKLQLSSIFGDSMVIQQQDSIAFFGKAVPNQQVTVATSWGTKNSSVANKEGAWKMKVLTPAASFDPQTVEIRTSTDTIVFNDVLVGEVWLCSGQSNMLFKLKADDHWTSEKANADNDVLRLFQVPANTYSAPKDTIDNAQWQSCSVATSEKFSAVAYYFGKALSESLPNTPIGLISSAFGSASAESFMSKETLLSKTYLAEHYQNYIAKVESKEPTGCYNAMIHPLVPFTIKGIIWYQGEANCVRASHYYEVLETMIASRRVQFINPDMPFYIAQLPPYNYNSKQQESGDEFSAATVREAQLKISENIQNTGIIVTTDVGNVENIHPTNKKPVGERLANLALHNSYGQKDKVFSGPKYKSYIVEGGKIRLSFDFVNNGIKNTNEELNWFTIAGRDKKFYHGNAFIDGTDIIVSSPFVEAPVAVRFAWHNAAEPNFFNTDGLPASPFKTDDWTRFTYADDITSWGSKPNNRN